MKKRILSIALAFAMVFAFIPALNISSAATETISVKIGDGEAVSFDTIEDAMKAAKAADDSLEKVVTLTSGTFEVQDKETLRLDEPKLTLKGAGQDATIINLTENNLVSGQAGILIGADDVTVEGLSVNFNNATASSAGAIKVTDPSGTNMINNVSIKNVALTATAKGYALNIHGVEGGTFENVTAIAKNKSAVGIANAKGIKFTGLQADGGGLISQDVVFNYEKNNVAYQNPCDVEFIDSTFAHNKIKSDRPADAAGGTDKVTLTGGDLVLIYNSTGTWSAASKAETDAIYNETQDKYYAKSALKTALSEAEAGDAIHLKDGTYYGPITIDKAVKIVGESKEGTIIKKTSKSSVDDVIHATADFELSNVTVQGTPGVDMHAYNGECISGIQAEAGLILDNVAIKDIRCTCGGDICGMQDGFGVWVEGEGDVKITNTEITGFQKTGIVSKTTGKVTIKDSVIVGAGPQGVIAQNGIQINSSKNAVVENNTILNLAYTADNEWKGGSVAVYVINVANATLKDNTTTDVDNYYATDLAEGQKTTVIDGAKTTVIKGHDGDKEDEVMVLPSELILDKEEIKLEAGQTDKVHVTVKPADTTEKIEVILEDEDVATITEKEAVKGEDAISKEIEITAKEDIDFGTTNIRVKVGKLEKEIKITVDNNIAPNGAFVNAFLNEDESNTFGGSYISVNMRSVVFDNSVELKVYAGEEVLVTSKLNGELVSPGKYGELTGFIGVQGEDQYWINDKNNWAVHDKVPTAVKLFIDGEEVDAIEIYTDVSDVFGTVITAQDWYNFAGTACSFDAEYKTDETSHWQECVCGKKQNEGKHTLVTKTDKEATCTEAGEQHQECDVCQYKLESETVPATGHKYDDKGKCTVCGVLTADAEEANKVDALIDAIGPADQVTLDSYDKIMAAKNAYEALTDEQKKLVTGVDDLNAAIDAYNKLNDDEEEITKPVAPNEDVNDNKDSDNDKDKDQKEESDSVKTGDDIAVGLLAGMLLLSGAGFVALRRKEK